MDTATFTVSVVLGWLFLTSGLSKLRGGRFAGDLANYRVMPVALVPPIATGLPWAEMVVGTAIVVLPWPTPALVLSAVLLLGMAAAVAINLMRGRCIPCGCRASEKPINWTLVTVDLFLSASATLTALNEPIPVVASLAGRSSQLSAADALATVTTRILPLTISRLITWWRILASAAKPGCSRPAGSQCLQRSPRLLAAIAVERCT